MASVSITLTPGLSSGDSSLLRLEARARLEDLDESELLESLLLNKEQDRDRECPGEGFRAGEGCFGPVELLAVNQYPSSRITLILTAIPFHLAGWGHVWVGPCRSAETGETDCGHPFSLPLWSGAALPKSGPLSPSPCCWCGWKGGMV